MFHMKLHKLLFFIFLFCLPFQTRILYNPSSAYINWYFSYNLAYLFYFSDVLLITCFISWLIFDSPNIQIYKNRLSWLILAFFAIILIGLFHVKQETLALYETLKILELLLLFAYIYANFNEKIQYFSAFAVLFASGVFQAILAILQFHVQHSLKLGFLGEYIAPLGTPGLATIMFHGKQIIRAYGTFPHPNMLAGFLLICFILGLYLFSNTAKAKWLILGGLFLILLALFFTSSRIGWVLALMSLLTYALFHVKQKEWAKIYFIAALAIISSATILIGYRPFFVSRATDSLASNANSSRTFFDQFGLKIFQSHPVLGVGIGQYIPEMISGFKLEPWQYQPPHNIFLFIAAELGLIGLILFVLTLYEIFRIAWRNRHDPLTKTLLLTGGMLVVIGMFDHYLITIQQGRLIFFTMLGLLAASGHLIDSHSNS